MSDAWNTLRAQLEFFSTPYPEEAIAFAEAHRAELTPFLVESLAQVADDPEIGKNPDYVLHLYAMHLLAVWRETAAYAPLVRIGHHPEAIFEQLLGDTATESYGRCMASVSNGDVTLLQALVEDAAAGHWARNAALDGLMVRVIEGDAPRADLIAYLIRFGDAEAARLRDLHGDFEEPQILNSVVSVATDIGAVELLERIRTWFDDELVDPTIADLKWIEQHISRPYEICRAKILQHNDGYVRSVKREIGWWSGFREDEPAQQPPAVVYPVHTVRQVPKIGRNDPCPCGSGKKYKKCCGT